MIYSIIPKGVYQNLNIHKDTLFILKWTKTNISFYIYWLSSPDINCSFCPCEFTYFSHFQRYITLALWKRLKQLASLVSTCELLQWEQVSTQCLS